MSVLTVVSIVEEGVIRILTLATETSHHLYKISIIHLLRRVSMSHVVCLVLEVVCDIVLLLILLHRESKTTLNLPCSDTIHLSQELNMRSKHTIEHAKW